MLTSYLFLVLLLLMECKWNHGFDCFQNDNGRGCQKWNKHTLTYYFPARLNPKVQNQREAFAHDVKHAFDLWSEVSVFTFIETYYDEIADIRISFEERSHGDCATLGMSPKHQCHFDFDSELAHAFPPRHKAREKLSKLRGAIHFNANEKWIAGSRRGTTSAFLLLLSRPKFPFVNNYFICRM